MQGLKETAVRLESCIECLGLEERGTYKKLLSERAKVLLVQVKDWIMFVDFL